MTPLEFQRQLRGLFAVLRTLVRATSHGHDSVEDYAAHLEGRIGALARVHEILMRAPEDGLDLYELISGEIISQVIPESRFRLSGPEVRIAPTSATALTLAFHELTVNALTHGAFATPEGCVEITWQIRDESGAACLFLDWRESGVDLAENALCTKGFGSELIERMLPYEINARTSLNATRNGVRVHLEIPAKASGSNWRQTPAV